jgi:DNA repair protein RecO (recombination protein O)
VALVAARSLILQSFPYSETSKILRLYTREHGLRSVIAKGAQRPKSRFGGLLEPFTEGTAGFSLREGRDLHTLSGWDLLRSRQALGRSLAAFAGASLLAELALRLGTEEAHPEVFDLLSASWDRIAASSPVEAETATLGGAWQLISLVGFEPQTDACVLCGRRMDPGEPARFDGAGGGVTCTRCRATGRVLAPGPRAELAELVRDGRFTQPTAHPATHRALLRAFLEGQVATERPLRSLDLFLAGDDAGAGLA